MTDLIVANKLSCMSILLYPIKILVFFCWQSICFSFHAKDEFQVDIAFWEFQLRLNVLSKAAKMDSVTRMNSYIGFLLY